MRCLLFVAALLSCLPASAAGPWLFLLQNPNPRAIANSGFPAAVMDYSRDGSDGRRLPASQVRGLKKKGVTALAYFSIGEAENYRFYWENSWVARKNSNQFTAGAPAWLGHTNPDWPGNYKVRYWDPDWRRVALRPYLDRIIAQGFRGVYLDIVDAYYYWGQRSSYGPGRETFQAGDPRGDEAEAARRMIDLVVWIAKYARAKTGKSFLIFPQNAEEILQYDRDGKYLRAISGVGSEDVFYDELRRQPRSEMNYRLQFLRRIRSAGKRVLSVDYVDTGNRTDSANAARIRNYVARCRAEGFDFYAARRDRELERINRVPGVQP